MLDALQILTGREASFEDVFNAEELAYSFYGKTVAAHIKRYFNPKSNNNPDTIAFYMKPTKSLNKGRRNKEEWVMTDEEKRVYHLIASQYLVEDFNYDSLKQMREMCQHPREIVQSAIAESISGDVMSIPYLYRIVEGLAVRKEHKRQQMEYRRKLFGVEDSVAVPSRGAAEIAGLMYDWQETIRNVELQRKVNKLFEGDQ